MKEELLVDSYYMYNFTGANTRVGPSYRNYDTQANSFQLSYAKIGLEVDADPVTVRADLGYGELARLISSPSSPPANGASSFAAQQAFVSLKMPGLSALSIDFGRFNTTAGAEVIEANRNWIYSRSLLFGIIPVTHTGLRLNYKINDMVSVQGSVVNGISNDAPDNNAEKTYGLSVAVAPLPTTSIIATAYIGKEPAGAGATATNLTRTTIDLVVAHNVSDQFGLNLNFDYVKWGDPKALGFSLMGRFVASEHLTLAARGEFLRDNGILVGSPDTGVNVMEGTLTLGLPFAGHFEARAELRGDFSGEAIFVTGDPENKKQQFTGTVAFLGFI